jgi:hypothetical protein
MNVKFSHAACGRWTTLSTGLFKKREKKEREKKKKKREGKPPGLKEGPR